jgi:hypothetical protein
MGASAGGGVVVLDDQIGAPTRRHSYAVVDGPEHALELSAEFVTGGLARSERVTLVGLSGRRAARVLTRLREDGVDPDGALRDGRLIIADEAVTAALYTMPAQQLTDRVIDQTAAAISDGHTGIRLGGMLLGLETSPHERSLSRLVREHPVTALCLYHPSAPTAVLAEAHALHDQQVRSTAVFNDPDLRVSLIPGRGVRLAGRVHSGNRAQVLSILTDAARTGRPNIDAASLRDIDPTSLHAILTSGLGLSLRRPSPLVRRLTRELAAQVNRATPAYTMARTGVPVPGQTAADVVTNLIHRVFGPTRGGCAESLLDWAGLLGHPAGPVAEVADRHRTTPATLTNRARLVTSRGTRTPLSPTLLRDAIRPTQPTEDHLGRQRLAELLGLPPPRSD